MDTKYSVPALDRAHAVLTLLAEEPYTWKLSDMSKQLNISKSTLHSLLHTMERLQWINRDRNETYAVGSALGNYGSASQCACAYSITIIPPIPLLVFDLLLETHYL